jgi:uncharacterized protein (DUF3820 family)
MTDQPNPDRLANHGLRRARPFFEGGALNFPKMPFGRWKGRSIGDLPRDDFGYARWLLSRDWFGQKYPDEALALALAIERYGEERQAAREAWQTELEERRRRNREEWLAGCKVRYVQRGVMPFGKFRSQSLAAVVRAEHYYRWFRGSAYSQASPELAADLEDAAARIIKGKIVVETEISEGCRIYRPAFFEAAGPPVG